MVSTSGHQEPVSSFAPGQARYPSSATARSWSVTLFATGLDPNWSFAVDVLAGVSVTRREPAQVGAFTRTEVWSAGRAQRNP